MRRAVAGTYLGFQHRGLHRRPLQATARSDRSGGWLSHRGRPAPPRLPLSVVSMGHRVVPQLLGSQAEAAAAVPTVHDSVAGAENSRDLCATGRRRRRRRNSPHHRRRSNTFANRRDRALTAAEGKRVTPTDATAERRRERPGSLIFARSQSPRVIQVSLAQRS